MREISPTEEIMNAVGLSDPNWCNGSSSCAGMRRKTLKNLKGEMAKRGLALSEPWEDMIKRADIADDVNAGNESVSNIYRVTIHAIHDAMARAEGKPGIEPQEGAEISLNHGGLRHFYNERVKRLQACRTVLTSPIKANPRFRIRLP